MTLVEQSTDIAGMSENDAIEITALIKQTGSILWSQVVRAFQGRAWAALGYDSWDAYCDAEFDGARIKLPREERTMIVASLADAGMSTRAIAAATGVSHMTVDRDLAAVTNVTPDTDPDDEIIDAEVIDDPAPQPRQVTGTDGKTYNVTTKPAAGPRREPLDASADRAAWNLRRSVESMERVFNDDRLAANKEQVTSRTQGHLLYTVRACQGLLDQLNQPTMNGEIR